nr:NSP4 [Rotavirus F]
MDASSIMMNIMNITGNDTAVNGSVETLTSIINNYITNNPGTFLYTIITTLSTMFAISKIGVIKVMSKPLVLVSKKIKELIMVCIDRMLNKVGVDVAITDQMRLNMDLDYIKNELNELKMLVVKNTMCRTVFVDRAQQTDKQQDISKAKHKSDSTANATHVDKVMTETVN